MLNYSMHIPDVYVADKYDYKGSHKPADEECDVYILFHNRRYILCSAYIAAQFTCDVIQEHKGCLQDCHQDQRQNTHVHCDLATNL